MKKILLLVSFFGAISVNAADLVITGVTDFGRIKVGKSKRLAFTISNPNPETVINFKRTLNSLSPFKIDSSTNCTTSLRGNDSCTIQITVKDNGIIIPQTTTLLAGGRIENPRRRIEASGLLTVTFFRPLITPPIARASSIGVNIGEVYTGKLIATNANTGGTLNFSIAQNPTQGLVQITNTATGDFTYTPNANAGVVDSFRFMATNGNSKSNVASVIVQLNWKRQLGGSTRDSLGSRAVDASGNVYLTGNTFGSFEDLEHKLGSDVFITKISASGVTLWKKQLTGNEADRPIVLDASGNVYWAGETLGSFEGLDYKGGYDVYITKISSSGEILWKNQLGSSGDDYVHGFPVVDANGNVYLTGRTNRNFEGLEGKGKNDVFITKISASGEILWKKQLGGTESEYPNGAPVLDASGNVYLAGFTTGSFEDLAHKGIADVFITKLSSESGDTLWKKQLGSSEDDVPDNAPVLDASGNVYLVAKTFGSFELLEHKGIGDVAVIKLSSSGEVLWKKQLGGTAHDSLYFTYGAPVLDANGNVYLCLDTFGSFEDLKHQGETDIAIIKLSSESGKTLWKKQLGGTGRENLSNKPILDASDNVYLMGSTEGSFEGLERKGDSFNIFITKLSASGEILWKKQLGAIGGTFFKDFVLDASGNVYLTANAMGGSMEGLVHKGGTDLFFTKLSSASGETLWKKQLGGSGIDYTMRDRGGKLDASGNVYLMGGTNGSFEGLENKGDYDVFIIKLILPATPQLS